MAPCPRCRRENPPDAPVCAGCGTPLSLSDEPAPHLLDVELDLDRRAKGGSVAEGDGEGAGAGDPADARELRPAAPARRIAAWAIDAAVLGILAALLWGGLAALGLPIQEGFDGVAWFLGNLPLLLPTAALLLLATFAYGTLAHALGGATLGKRIARIQVVGPDGRVPSPGRSAARTALAIVSVGLLGLGLLPALLTPSGRALHDLLAGTRVVDLS
jgi:uncharacterized RDD family membrane protein YckC